MGVVVFGDRNIALPEGLATQIDSFLTDNKDGYRSRAEVVAAAVREFLDRKRSGQPAQILSSAGSSKTELFLGLAQALQQIAAERGMDPIQLLQAAAATPTKPVKEQRSKYVKPR